MAKHTISEAAKLTGKARSTLHRHLKEGRLSKGQGADGQPAIDTAELVRVYGPLQGRSSSATDPIGQHATPERDAPLQAKIDAMKDAQIDQLRADLDDARKERDDWKTQAQRLSGLLTDQRSPAPESVATKQQGNVTLQSVIARFWKKRDR